MNTTVSTGTREHAPHIPAPRRDSSGGDDPSRPDRRRQDVLRRELPRQRRRPQRDPGRSAAGGQQTRLAPPGEPQRRGLPSRPRRAEQTPRPGVRPADAVGLVRPAYRAARDAAAGARRHASRTRTPFILLVLALLGGGLVCLLVINTTLAAASFQISNLQRENTEATQRVQELQQQVAADQSAGAIQRRALQLGMRAQPALNFVDLRTGRRYATQARARGAYAVPGYGR
jgi:hypothetical protein